jgi:class 3 adenylate cyclase
VSESLHAGTVTLLFTDIEGSTQLLRELGDRYGDLVGAHRRIIREAATAAGGTEVDTQGDAFFFAFARARDAAQGAADAQRGLRSYDWPEGKRVRVRMGLHTGEPTVGDEGYLGLDVVRAARIGSAANGGQILASETTRALLGRELPHGLEIRDLGHTALKDLDDGERGEPPRTEAPSSSEFGERLAATIQSQVLHELEQGFAAGRTPPAGRPRRGLEGTIRRLLARRRRLP